MNDVWILAAVDAEIARLRKVRAVLVQAGVSPKKVARTAVKKATKRGIMSAAGRANIVEAQRKRWAAIRKNGKG